MNISEEIFVDVSKLLVGMSDTKLKINEETFLLKKGDISVQISGLVDGKCYIFGVEIKVEDEWIELHKLNEKEEELIETIGLRDVNNINNVVQRISTIEEKNILDKIKVTTEYCCDISKDIDLTKISDKIKKFHCKDEKGRDIFLDLCVIFSSSQKTEEDDVYKNSLFIFVSGNVITINGYTQDAEALSEILLFLIKNGFNDYTCGNGEDINFSWHDDEKGLPVNLVQELFLTIKNVGVFDKCEVEYFSLFYKDSFIYQ